MDKTLGELSKEGIIAKETAQFSGKVFAFINTTAGSGYRGQE